MSGKGFLAVIGLTGLILLTIGLAIAASAVIAVAIGFELIAGILFAFSARRSRQVGSEHAAVAADRRHSDHVAKPPPDRGAPRSGEGGAEEAHRVRVTGR